MNGYARFAPDDDNMDMIPLLETILKEIPAPDCEPNGPVALQICTVDHSSFVGRIGVGRLFSGTIHKGEPRWSSRTTARATTPTSSRCSRSRRWVRRSSRRCTPATSWPWWAWKTLTSVTW